MIGDVLRVVRVCKGNKCFVKAPSTFASFVAFVLFYGINRSKAVDFFLNRLMVICRGLRELLWMRVNVWTAICRMPGKSASIARSCGCGRMDNRIRGTFVLIYAVFVVK